MVILTCKLSTHITKSVDVNISDPLYILLDKLNIYDKKTKFTFNGGTYCLASTLTFQEIGITGNCIIFINN